MASHDYYKVIIFIKIECRARFELIHIIVKINCNFNSIINKLFKQDLLVSQPEINFNKNRIKMIS